MAQLDEFQRRLLATLVEASRRLPDEARPSFFYSHVFGDQHPRIDHPGLREETHISFGDIEVMSRAGLLIHRRQIHGMGNIDLTPAAFELYERIKREEGSPVARVEADLRSFIDSAAFRAKYGHAYDNWSKAADLLWKADRRPGDPSTIGHLCREAMQDFAAVLVGAPAPPSPDPDRAKTVLRLRQALGGVTSATHRAFNEALLAYWGALSDLVQRQEHAGAKDGTPVTWDDARRVVFQTAVVMFEIDASR
jgi:hypothetical protein